MHRYLTRLLFMLVLLVPVAVQAATLNFIAGPNGTISGTTSQTVSTGGTATPVSAVPNPGYHFIDWTGNNGFVTTTDNPLTVSNVSVSQDITANFTLSIDRYDVAAHGLSRAADVKGGASHTVVLRTDGTVVAWGGTDGQSDVPPGLAGVTAIGSGAYHTLVAKSDGTVLAWGTYHSGTAAGPVGPTVPSGLTGVIAVAGGYAHSIALKSDGTVVAWGDTTYGQTTVPSGLSGVIAIAAGHFHNVVLKKDGTVVAWGRNSEGQCNIPAGLSGVTAVDAKAYHTVALKSDGTVVCWGDNELGQSNVPPGLSGIKAIAAGGHHTIALKTDGTIVAWGDNEYGQSTTPPGLVGVTLVAAGTYHTLAMKENVAVVGWGHNQSNQCIVPLSVYQGISNGSVSCNPTTVDFGTSSVCTISPAAGFTLTLFAVNGVIYTGSVTNNSITLSNIQIDQSITAVFGTATQTSVSLTSPANGASFTAPAAITVNATATAGTGATVSKVEFFAGANPIGTATTAPYGISWNNVAAGSYSLTARVTDSLGATATSAPVGVTVTAPSLPAPWLAQDIGGVGVAGTSGYANGVFAVSGSGSDIWGTVDSFRYVYQTFTGDAQIVARVVSLQNTNSWAKAGVMIRDTLVANSIHAMVDVTPVNGAEFSRRTSTGGSTTVSSRTGVAAPYWVKLVRSGSTFTGYVSTDAVSWVQVGSSSIAMGSTVDIGLIVCSHSNTVLNSATFDNVAVSAAPAAAPTVAITSPVSGANFTAPATFSITASAGAGSGATVKQVDFFVGSTLLGTATAAPYSVVVMNLSAGGYSLSAKVTDSLGASATSSPVTITVAASGLPAPWSTQDIGSVGIAGSASYLNGTFTLKGSGSDIWGTTDAFRFVYKQLSGDGQIVARVASLQNTNSWAKAGVMIRQALTANSVHAMVDVTPVNGAEFSRRTSTGGSTAVTAFSSAAAPYWVKLVRSGSTLTGYVSADGVNWVQVGSSTIAMTNPVYIGLIVNSHNNSLLNTATFDSVQ